jgi:hypothetical protein
VRKIRLRYIKEHISLEENTTYLLRLIVCMWQLTCENVVWSGIVLDHLFIRWPHLNHKTSISVDRITVKKFTEFLYFFYQTFQKRENPYADKGFFGALQRRNFFVFWAGKSIPLSAGVIFSSLLNVIFPYLPYFPNKFTGKLMEDSWLATGAPGRVAIKFCRWEKNSPLFVKLLVWKSVKILVNPSYYHRENCWWVRPLFGPFWKYLAKIRLWICKANYFTRLFLGYAVDFSASLQHSCTLTVANGYKDHICSLSWSYPTGSSSAIMGLHLGACSLQKNVFFSVYNILFNSF